MPAVPASLLLLGEHNAAIPARHPHWQRRPGQVRSLAIPGPVTAGRPRPCGAARAPPGPLLHAYRRVRYKVTMSANSAGLSGRTFLITGANTGIGRATADDLARRGGKVFVACRSAEKGRAAATEIAAATGNDAVAFLPLDLADLASVRNCAAEFLARGNRCTC